MDILRSITLYYQGGKSDKFYTISVVARGGEYSVPFTYGRRNTSGMNGNKGTFTLLGSADGVYDKVVREKEAKGYKEGPGWQQPIGTGSPTPSAPMSPPTPAPVKRRAPKVGPPTPAEEAVYCQVLTDLMEAKDAVDLVADDAFVAQQKHDGKRRLLKYADGKITGFNRKGKPTGYVQTLDAELTNIANHSGVHQFLIDSEEVGDELFVFDLLEHGGADIRWKPYAQRLSDLKDLLGSCDDLKHIHLVYTAVTMKQKRELMRMLMEGNHEGIVFKRFDAPYTAGEGSDQFKYKFYATASCRVAKINIKRSVALEVYDLGSQIAVGNCTIPPNKDIPQIGDIVEVRYLYYYGGGSLYQPVFLGLRDDRAFEDCLLSKLKLKATG